MSTITHTTLLLGLKTPSDDRAWSEFYARYEPMLVGFARRLGLNEHDAQDAAQDALLAFADGYRHDKYDRDKGRLRTWLFGIATNKIREIQRRRGKDLTKADLAEKTLVMSQVPDEHSISEMWESEWRRTVMDSCMKEVCRHMEFSTIRAFELFVLREWPADKVAQHLGLSRNAVFKAKRRVLSRMRGTYKHLQTDW